MYKAKHIFMVTICLSVSLLFFACKGKGKEATVETILTDSLNEHIRITNDVFYERSKESGKGTSIKLAGQVKVGLDKSGSRAVTDTSLEVRYVNENKSVKTPIRVIWQLKNGTWSAEMVLPDEFGFLIAFDKNTLEKLKKKR